MQKRTRQLARFLILIISLLSPFGSAPITAQGDEHCFPQTGHCISGAIRRFWERNGGLPVFGYPLGPQQEDFIEGKRIQAQWFERNRIELHPENAPPFDVLLGRLSEDRLAMDRRDWRTFPQSQPQAGCRFFPETGHNVCGRILAAWQANGLEQDGQPGFGEGENLALFGLPLSDVQTETLEDGKQYTVQWFERARFELHPENVAPFDVLLGRLGSDLYPQQPPSYVPPLANPGDPPPPAPAPPGPVVSPATSNAPAPRPDQAFLVIINTTGKVVRVSLIGPTPFSWSVVGNRFEAPIAPGGYQVIVSVACGQATTNFSVGAGQVVELPVTCPADQPTAHLRLINNTGGFARLFLNGPMLVILNLATGGAETRKIRPGDYSGTATAPCGGVPISFSIGANGEYELALSCPNPTSTVRIANTSDAPIRVNLVGPTPASLTVPAGQTVDRSVVPGDYEIIVDSPCGRESQRFAIADGEIRTFTYSCVRPEATIEIINNTGGGMTVSLRGPTSGTYRANEGSTSITVTPGSYSMTVSARCGSQSEQFTIESGETIRFGPYFCT